MDKPIDLTKTPAGNVTTDLFAGQPADTLKKFLLARAGVPQTHPLHDDLGTQRLGHTGNDVDRLPLTFPPTGFTGTLTSVQDWFDLIDAEKVTPVEIQAALDKEKEGQALPAEQDDHEQDVLQWHAEGNPNDPSNEARFNADQSHDS